MRIGLDTGSDLSSAEFVKVGAAFVILLSAKSIKTENEKSSLHILTKDCFEVSFADSSGYALAGADPRELGVTLLVQWWTDLGGTEKGIPCIHMICLQRLSKSVGSDWKIYKNTYATNMAIPTYNRYRASLFTSLNSLFFALHTRPLVRHVEIVNVTGRSLDTRFDIAVCSDNLIVLHKSIGECAENDRHHWLHIIRQSAFVLIPNSFYHAPYLSNARRDGTDEPDGIQEQFKGRGEAEEIEEASLYGLLFRLCLCQDDFPLLGREMLELEGIFFGSVDYCGRFLEVGRGREVLLFVHGRL
jgi:hypothetical protein